MDTVLCQTDVSVVPGPRPGTKPSASADVSNRCLPRELEGDWIQDWE